MRAIVVMNEALAVPAAKAPQPDFLKNPVVLKHISELTKEEPVMMGFETWRTISTSLKNPIFLCLRKTTVRQEAGETGKNYLNRFLERAGIVVGSVKEPDLILSHEYAQPTIDKIKANGKIKQDPWFIGSGKTLAGFLENIHTLEVICVKGTEPTPSRIDLSLFKGFEMRNSREEEGVLIETWHRPYFKLT